MTGEGVTLIGADWSVLGVQNFAQAKARIGSLSPYLSLLFQEHGAWLDGQAARNSRELWQELTRQAKGLAHSPDLDHIMRDMRRLKRKAHLYCALLDLSRQWDWAAATRALTEFADACLQAAFQFAAYDADIISAPDDIAPGIFALALGKYGGYELNYSSDIDFIIFYDPDEVALPPGKTAERQIIRLVQKTVKILGEINGDGYVFRTDLRLRPDPRSTSVAVSTRSAERYYEALGQNWERAAMIKARPCAGDVACAQGFIDSVLTPYIWRRSLDFAAIDDIQAMARQIQSIGDRANIKAAGHNIKLGRGGIRAIEFYAQTQQLILGGRRPELRSPRTLDVLDRLNVAGFIEDDTRRELSASYAFFRDIEHRIQMIDDAQTHILPDEDSARKAIANLSGFEDLARFDRAVTKALSRVHAAYAALYSGTETLAAPEGTLSFTGVEPEDETLKTLEKMGFSRREDVWFTMSEWLGGRIAATRHERAREVLTALAPFLLAACQKTGDADTAFFRFAEFFTKLTSGVTLLSYFKSKPDTLEFLIGIISLAPFLSETLSKKPEILDALIEPDFVQNPLAIIGTAYTLTAADDAEAVMNHIRRRVREDRFRIGAALLSRNISWQDSAAAMTLTADAAIKALVPAAEAATIARHGAIDAEIAVLGLGKLGTGELSLQSDLDLMVLYAPTGDDLHKAHEQAALFTKRLVNYLSATTAEGPLFEVDMALRPSGGAGPITVSLEAFEKYYAADAWTWEFMALTNARIVHATSPAFGGTLSTLLARTIASAKDRHIITEDVKDMRVRLLRDKSPRGDWDIKRVRGGLTELEFLIQNHALRMGHSEPAEQCVTSLIRLNALSGLLEPSEFAALKHALSDYHHFRQIMGLSWSGVFTPEHAPSGLIAHLCESFDSENMDELSNRFAKHSRSVSGIFDAQIGNPEIG